MKKRKIEISFEEYERIEELSPEDRSVLTAARQAGEMAYAPYSGFRVGAAVLLENLEIIQANNQENAAYPSGLCAERIALFYASSKFPGIGIRTIAVSAVCNKNAADINPCGACCQVMGEYEDLTNSILKVILDGGNQIRIISGVVHLLPFRFQKNALKQNDPGF